MRTALLRKQWQYFIDGGVAHFAGKAAQRFWKRPLLTGDLKAKFSSLLAKRAEHYNSFPMRITWTGKLPSKTLIKFKLHWGGIIFPQWESDVIVGKVGQDF